LKKKGGVFTFTVHHGDIGKCPTDSSKGNSRSNIPHSERVEVQGPKFAQGKRYIFRAEVSMDPQFSTAPKTTIFQVHQWDSKACNCGPYVMIRFDKSGRLTALILKADHQHKSVRLGRYTRSDFEGKWVELAVDIDTSVQSPSVSVYVDGKRMTSEPVLVQPGGTVFFKAGLYRHGRLNPQLPSDRVYVRKTGYVKVK